MPRRPQVPLALTSGLFTLAEARAAGISRAQLQGKAWRRVGRNLFAWSGLASNPLHELRALSKRLPANAVFSGSTAAWLHGLDVPVGAPFEVIVPPDAGVSGRAGVRLRRTRLSVEEIVQRRGLSATSIARTLFDLARSWSLTEAVVIIDSALHAGLVAKAELQDAPYGKKFRQIVTLSEPRTESQMESRLRMLLILGGLPRPQVQVDLHDVSGFHIARADLYYPSHRLAIEYDGATHRASLIQDDRRQNDLIRANYTLLRFTAPDVLRTPELTVAQVRGLLQLPRSLASRPSTSSLGWG